jgi:exonuclease III
MNIVSWNCRGLGNLRAVLVLHNLVKTQEPKILFLMETKLDIRMMEFVRIKLRFKHCFMVPSLGRSGGLALLWNDEVELYIHNYSINHIDAHVRSQGELRWRFTGFYGHSVAYRRRESWALLDKLHSMDDLPWSLMGDFNEILSSDERLGESAGS